MAFSIHLAYIMLQLMNSTLYRNRKVLFLKSKVTLLQKQLFFF